MSSNIDKPVATSLSSQQAKVAQRAGGKTIAELTAFCKKLQEEKEGAGNETKKGAKTEEEESQTVTHHPFLVKEKPDITIPPVIFPVSTAYKFNMYLYPGVLIFVFRCKGNSGFEKCCAVIVQLHVYMQGEDHT